MSITPTTPEPTAGGAGRGRELVYTVVGGPRPDRLLAAPHLLAVLVLNRGPRHARPDSLGEALELGAGEVITVDRSTADVDTLTREHPEVRFLLVREALTTGELINIGVTEARSRHVLVVWSDMRVDPPGLARVLSSIEDREATCVAPALLGPDGGPLPVWSAPTLRGSRFSVLHSRPVRAVGPTLYPFDYVGLYRKDRFLALGGFAPDIGTPYWQKLDLGLRTHLFGGTLQLDRELRMAYRSEIPPEDTTPDPAYRRFYLRSVAVRRRGGDAYRPRAALLPFLLRSGTGLLAAAAEFRECRRWVRTRRRSYRRELAELVELWGTEG